MTEGTKSWFFGGHSIIHMFAVFRAWRWYYGKWPNIKEIICIILHDIGLIGMNYLSDKKDGHWRRGAEWAFYLFGLWGWELCAGHTDESHWMRSKLFYPDKLSVLFVPDFLLHWENMVEHFDRRSMSPFEFRERMRENMKKGFPMDAHEIYLEGVKKKNSVYNKNCK